MIQIPVTEAEAIELAKLLDQTGKLPEVKGRIDAELDNIQRVWDMVSVASKEG